MNDIESSKQCVICLDRLQPESNCLVFSPLHCDCIVITHLECGTHWLETEKKCIICKHPISSLDYYHGNYNQISDIIITIANRQRQAILRKECWDTCQRKTEVSRKFLFYLFVLGTIVGFALLVSLGINQEIPYLRNHTISPWGIPIPDKTIINHTHNYSN